MVTVEVQHNEVYLNVPTSFGTVVRTRFVFVNGLHKVSVKILASTLADTLHAVGVPATIEITRP